MKDAWRMCTNSVNILIFPFSAGITLKVIGNELDSRQVTSLSHRMDVYQVQLLLAVSVDVFNTVNTVE